MAGLRERQKADRDRRIVEAAVTHFRREGFRAAHIDELAEHAGLSVGTIYNYYQTKGDILVAIVAMEVEEVLDAGARIVADPPSDVADALLALTFCYYDHSLHYLTKEMWRTAMALAVSTPDTPAGRHYNDLDARLARQVGDLLTALQQRGRIVPDLDSEAMGQVVFNNLNQTFMDFTRDEAMPLAALRERVTAQTRPLARLMSGR